VGYSLGDGVHDFGDAQPAGYLQARLHVLDGLLGRSVRELSLQPYLNGALLDTDTPD
jgi:hypothetical protein